MVHCAAPVQACRTWNDKRPAGAGYSAAVFDDLAQRFELPDGRNKWDRPLFTLQTASGDWAQALEEVVAAMKDPEQQTNKLNKAAVLVPSIATAPQAVVATNLLHELDSAAQEVIASISEAQQAVPGAVHCFTVVT